MIVSFVDTYRCTICGHQERGILVHDVHVNQRSLRTTSVPGIGFKRDLCQECGGAVADNPDRRDLHPDDLAKVDAYRQRKGWAPVRSAEGPTGRAFTTTGKAPPCARGCAMTPDRPHVRVDPAQRFGQPNVKGIACDAIGAQLVVGMTVDELMEDYDLNRADILVACWYLGMYGPSEWRKQWHKWADTAGDQMWNTGTVDYDDVPDPPTDVDGAT